MGQIFRIDLLVQLELLLYLLYLLLFLLDKDSEFGFKVLNLGLFV